MNEFPYGFSHRFGSDHGHKASRKLFGNSKEIFVGIVPEDRKR